jgi:hypothetical protein
MGQLTNLYVSSSYQGLLKLTDSTTGLTGTLQPVQDGLGGDSPLQISKTEINISGSLTVNGIPVSNVNTGSFVTTSSFNTYTSSVNTKLAGLDIETGSLQSQINSKLNTSSFNSYTSSNDSKVNSLIAATGSYVTETESGSFMITGSVAGDTLTFTKGNGSQFSLQVNTGSLPSGVVSGSQQIINLGFATTGSVNQKLDTGSFNSYTSSNDSKVNSLIAGTGSYATTSSLTSLSQSIATTDLGQDNRLGSLESKTGSYATTGSNNFVGQQNINNSVNITGSLNVTGEITALSASITYLETIYQTSSVIFSSGSNILGDEASDTQTLFGTVRLPNGPLSVTGSVTATNFTGSLEGTASYATNALSASYAPSNPLPSGIISGSVQISDLGFATTSSVNTKLDTGSFNTYSGDTLNVINQKLDTGSFNSYTSSNDSKVNSLINATGSYVTETESGSFMTTGSISGNVLTFTKGDGSTFGLTIDTGSNSNRDGLITTGSAVSVQSITGSLILSGSAGVELDVKGDQTNTGSLTVRSGSLSTISNATTINVDSYLTSSIGSSNIIKGWGENPAAGGPGANQANYTSSLRITGSNNMVSMPLLRATAVGGGVGLQGYISGSDNTFATNGGGIYLNTGSLLFPKTTNNYIGANSSMLLNFTTSSLAGGHPTIQNNTLYAGQIAINSNSGSVTAVAANIINGGSIISTQNFVTNQRPSIGTNIVGNTIALNHISSSINYQTNFSNSPVTINNHLSSSITNNILNVTNNTILGGSQNTGLNIWVSGSQNSNAARQVIDNLIGGKNIIVSSSFVSSSVANLNASLVYGQGLGIIANHSGNLGGTAIVGRFNDTGSLGLAQDVVFAVGTGTAAASRRTGLYVTSGSLVGVSGSMDVKGNSVMTGSLTVSGSFGSINGIGDVILSGTTKMYETSGFPLQVDGTINSKRLHFNSNPFNTNPSSNLGALRFEGNNQQFYLTNYDIAQITTQSIVSTFVNTGSAYVETSLGANNRGVDTYLRLTNSSGTGSLSTNVNTIVSGSLVVTGSLSVGGNLQFNVGDFYSTQTQSGSANVSGSVTYNNTGISNGVTLASNSRLTIANSGVYSITFSAQLKEIGGTDTIYLWLKKNGTNVADTGTKTVVRNNDENIMTVEYIVQAAANDYYEIVFQNANGHAQLFYEAASGNIPATPSIITTVKQVR